MLSNKRFLVMMFNQKIQKLVFLFIYELFSSDSNIGSHVRAVLSIKDFNPNATNRIDLDIALIDLRGSIREPILDDVDKTCTICQEKFIGTGVVNSLRCNHIYHHLCIVQWIRNNLSCPTCREACI